MDLRDYEQTKFKLAEILRSACLAVPRDSDVAKHSAQKLFARLADDRFNLVVAGRFSRGKTSLINALLGSGRLPTGVAPLTSVITSITYGSQEKVLLKYDGRILDHKIKIEELPQYITQHGNPENI